MQPRCMRGSRPRLAVDKISAVSLQVPAIAGERDRGTGPFASRPARRLPGQTPRYRRSGVRCCVEAHEWCGCGARLPALQVRSSRDSYGDIVIAGDGDDRPPGPRSSSSIRAGTTSTSPRPRRKRARGDLGRRPGRDDRWIGSGMKPRGLGCGILGYGYAIDIAGDDLYRRPRYSRTGVFGVGILVQCGALRYRGRCSPGASLFGLGIISDLAGSTNTTAPVPRPRPTRLRRARRRRRVRSLRRRRHRAPLSLAADRRHNTSLAQGAARGPRPTSATDSRSPADRPAGWRRDDVYGAGLFAQGRLLVRVGISTMRAGTIAGDLVRQGAAHFSIGALIDEVAMTPTARP
jgi:hypothetical protein